MRSSDKFVETTTYSKERFGLHLTNLGNHNDTIQLKIENEEELNDEGFEVALTQSIVNLDECEEKFVMVNIDTPNGLNGYGLHKINISAHSIFFLEETGQYMIETMILRVRILDYIFFQSIEFCAGSLIILMIIIIISILMVIKKLIKNK
jgi:hypothetical protein